MTLEEESRRSYYRETARLSETHDVWIVQHTESRKLFVRKRLSVYDLRVYRFLQTHPLQGTPAISSRQT